jgi:nitroreductase
MEFDKVIFERRSIRKYKNISIQKSDINYILSNAILSPSAHNRQPWLYFVFTDKKKSELLLLISDYITKKQQLTYYEKIMKNCLSFLFNAGAVILVYTDLEDVTINDYLSLGSSIEHICLSASNIGIGSLWLGVIRDFEELLKNNYNFENKKLISAVILGYPYEQPNPRPRKNLQDIVKFM